MKTLNVCPSLLSEGYHTYSPLALRRLFNGKQVSHLLSFSLKTEEKTVINLCTLFQFQVIKESF